MQFFLVTSQTNWYLRRLIVEVSRSHTFQHSSLGTTPLDEWSTRPTDLYLTTHKIHKRHATVGVRTRNPSNRAATMIVPLVQLWQIIIMKLRQIYILFFCAPDNSCNDLLRCTILCSTALLRDLGFSTIAVTTNNTVFLSMMPCSLVVTDI